VRARVIREVILFGIVVGTALLLVSAAAAQVVNDPKIHVKEVVSGSNQASGSAGGT
jgi:hypothetical protein